MRPALLLLVGCQHWSPAPRCDVDSDCALDQACHPEGHYCELDRRDVVVGVITPLDGTIAAVEPLLAEALEVARFAIQDAGGVLDGRQVDFRAVNDRPATDLLAILEADLFDDGPVHAFAGPLYSDAALQLADTLEARQIPALVDADTVLLDDLWQGCDRWTFSISTPGPLNGLLGGRFLAEQGCSVVTVVQYEGTSGADLADAARLALDDAGVPHRTVQLSKDLLDDYSAVVADLKAGGANCGIYYSSIRVSNALMVEWRQDAPADWTWVGAWGEPTFASAPVTGLYDGFFTMESSTPNPQVTEIDQFQDLYERAIGPWPVDGDGVREIPDVLMTRTFDLAVMAALSIDIAGTSHPGPSRRDAIWKLSEGRSAFGPSALGALVERDWSTESTHYSGPSGDFRFSASGRTTDWPDHVSAIEHDALAPAWFADQAVMDRLARASGFGDRTPSACSAL